MIWIIATIVTICCGLIGLSLGLHWLADKIDDMP